jgi:hypothetical protein
VFKLSDPKRIAMSLKRSSERSKRKKTGARRSAFSMLTFYINSEVKALSPMRSEKGGAKIFSWNRLGPNSKRFSLEPVRCVVLDGGRANEFES